jgi:hypothetical protein
MLYVLPAALTAESRQRATERKDNMSEQHSAYLSARYIRFAEEEVRGHSPLYDALARGVAADRDVIEFLTTLPREKQQPNLLLASVRHLFGVPVDWHHFLQSLSTNFEAVRSVMLTHSTQTNEPARCATLLPVLAQLPQPLALIEVGASAGLCLLPDLYGYDYGGHVIHPEPTETKHPVFACSASETTPLPKTMPQIVWRAGLDLNPLNAADPAQAEWLETLVWPEQTERLANLQAALKIAAVCRPRIVKGDLLGDCLAQLCREAPKNATLVVFHTAVLAYVAGQAERRAFAKQVMSFCPYWISNESPRVFPRAVDNIGMTNTSGRFLLSVNGSPMAWTDPHGASLDWIAGQRL